MSPDHSQRTHARYSASTAHRWFRCPGSVRLCEGVPNRPSAYAAEGTQAHERLEECLAQGVDYGYVYGEEVNTTDMGRSIQVAIDYIAGIYTENPDAVMLVEHRFSIPSEAAPGEVFGTCDCVIHVPSLRLLYVIDYKHGAGVVVDVRGNEQLRFYALGALSAHPEWDVDTVALVIVQPRAPDFALPIPEEWVPVARIHPLFAEELESAIRATKDEYYTPLVPGEKQCRFCPAATVCPARERQALAAVGETFSSVRQVTAESLLAAGELPPKRVAEILDAADLIRDWLRRVEQRGVELVRDGTGVPGRKLVEAQARRQWIEDVESEDLALRLGELTGDDLDFMQFMRPVTITEAEKLVKDAVRERTPKGQKKAAVEEVTRQMAFLTTKKSSGNLMLVRAEDPRPAVDPASAAFAGVVALPYVTEEAE